jgi:hypothetical protein
MYTTMIIIMLFPHGLVKPYVIIGQITGKALEYNSPVYFCFIDLERGLNTLELKTVLKILELNNVPIGLIIYIYIYTHLRRSI